MSRVNGKSEHGEYGSAGHMESYDPGYYIVPGQDHNGHSVRVWCRVQPTQDYEMDVIVNSRNWPFKMKGDFVRWAIWEGIRRIEKMKPVPGSMIVVAETIMDQCRAAEMWLKFKSSVDAAEKTVRNLLDSGNEPEALKLLSALRTHVMKLEEASWRDQWMREFEKRFGHIFSRAKEKAIRLNQTSLEEQP
jgi:hypothetical protein